MQVEKTNNSLLVDNIGYIAGSISGIAQVLIGQPFDIVKVRLQASKNPNVTMGRIIKKLISKEGPSGFYKGTMAPLVGMSGIISIQFGVLEYCKELFTKAGYVDQDGKLKAQYIALGGSLACIAACSLTIPVEHIRIRMQLQKAGHIKYLSTAGCFQSIFSNYGVRGLFKGTTPSILRESVIGLQYGIYEGLKRIQVSEDQRVQDVYSVSCGGIGGLIVWSLAYPFDCVKSRIQGDSIRNPKFKSTLDCFKRTSFSNLYKGIGPCLVRAFPVNCGGFFVYETAKNQILNKYENKQH